MDFSSLPPAAQKELATVLSDEFCYCGCPHTAGRSACAAHTPCQHAKRMARLAALGRGRSGDASDIIVAARPSTTPPSASRGRR